MIRVVIADDALLVRQGLVAVLATLDDIEVVGQGVDKDSLIALVAEQEPDVVITDVRMPPTNLNEGVTAALEIRASYPKIGVVVLSQDAEPSSVLELFEAGTQGLGYLLKENIGDRHQLRVAIEAVMSGSSSIDPDIVEIIVQARSRQNSALSDLTDREREVLAKIAEGAANAAIAQDLSMSTKSVEKHISSIFSKLHLDTDGASNRRVLSVLLWLAETD